MENTKDYVWEHKFRPARLKDVILPQDYRNFFNKIIESGASMNLILASSTPNDLANAILDGNDKYFKSFPGVGAKLSQQIILDLKGKV